jgi:hypothetical protein
MRNQFFSKKITRATLRLGVLVGCGCLLLGGSVVGQSGGWLRLYGPQWIANQIVADSSGGYFVAGSNVEADGRRWAFVQHLDGRGDTLWSRAFRPTSKSTGLVWLPDTEQIGVLTRTFDIDSDSLHFQRFSTDGAPLGVADFVAVQGKTLAFPPNELHAWGQCLTTANSPLGIDIGPVSVIDLCDTLRATWPQATLLDFAVDAPTGEVLLLLWQQVAGLGFRNAVVRLDPTGQPRWVRTFRKFDGRFGRLTRLANGDWVTYQRTANDGRAYRLSATDGTVLDSLDNPSVWGELGLLAADPLGDGFFLCDQSFAQPNRVLLQRFDATGALRSVTQASIPGYEDRSLFVRTFLPLRNGHFLVSGQISTNSGNNEVQAFLAEMDETGAIFRHFLKIKTHDAGTDCTDATGAAEGAGIPYAKFQIKKNGAPDATLYVADATGRVHRAADAGTYVVTPLPPNPTWAACMATSEVTASGTPGDTTPLSVPMRPVTRCPYLTVDVGTPELRCGSNAYFLRYCNTGTGPAIGARVQVRLDEGFRFLNSPKPHQVFDNQFVEFALGDLAPGQCGELGWSAWLDCAPDEPANTRRTHCVEAHIFPDTFCVAQAGWSGARLAVRGACVGDSTLRFVIRNVGDGPTRGAVEYIVIEDIVIRSESSSAWPPFGQLSLAAGDSLVLSLPANGHTWSVRVRQDTLFPGTPTAIATVEACGGEEGAIDFRVTHDDGDQSPSVAVDCRQFGVAGKLAFPAGTATDQCLESGREVEYLLVFRNETAAPVRQVVIRDTLSQLLDLQTVAPGVSSHFFHFEMQSAARVLEWRFDSLNLPSAAVDDSAAVGFVKFRVRTLADVSEGTRLFNRAWVWLDARAPIRSEVVGHTIRSRCLAEAATTWPAAPCLGVAPNPVAAGEPLRFFDACAGPSEGLGGVHHVQLLDAWGREVLPPVRLDPTGRLRVPPDLPAGVYVARTLDAASAVRVVVF